VQATGDSRQVPGPHHIQDLAPFVFGSDGETQQAPIDRNDGNHETDQESAS